VAGVRPDAPGVHNSHLDPRLVERIPLERFDLPFEASVRAALAAAEGTATTASRRRLAEILNERRSRIEAMLARASDLARGLRIRSFEPVLCHADIHLANILVSDDGAVHLMDWDGPIRAPQERDLLFVIGSRVAGTVAPADEDAFFEGYGRVDVDPEALIYYRYERVLSDIGESGRSVFEQSDLSELDRAREVDLAEDQFAPGSVLETAELVSLPWTRVGI
jgi:spectinomycin phosphotransferase